MKVLDMYTIVLLICPPDF